MHCTFRLIKLNNLHNIVHRTPQSNILATPMAAGSLADSIISDQIALRHVLLFD